MNIANHASSGLATAIDLDGAAAVAAERPVELAGRIALPEVASLEQPAIATSVAIANKPATRANDRPRRREEREGADQLERGRKRRLVMGSPAEMLAAMESRLPI